MLGHLVSGKGLEVDKAKIEVIQNLPLPTILQDLRSFLGHVGFYRRFIRDFTKVSKPLTTLLCKDKDFFIDKEGERAFEMLKLALIKAPILQSPNWDFPFEITCDASEYVVGEVLGQRSDKKPTAIWYASKTLAEAQMNYTTTKKELLAVVYALEKFRPYILGIAARMGLQFLWIEANLLGFFLVDVRNSRGKFDEIKEKFVINPAPIASQSSLNVGGTR